MINEIPICACDEVYRNGAHHPECPVLREIESLRQRVAELKSALGKYGSHDGGKNAKDLQQQVTELKSTLATVNAKALEWKASSKNLGYGNSGYWHGVADSFEQRADEILKILE